MILYGLFIEGVGLNIWIFAHIALKACAVVAWYRIVGNWSGCIGLLSSEFNRIFIEFLW